MTWRTIRAQLCRICSQRTPKAAMNSTPKARFQYNPKAAAGPTAPEELHLKDTLCQEYESCLPLVRSP